MPPEITSRKKQSQVTFTRETEPNLPRINVFLNKYGGDDIRYYFLSPPSEVFFFVVVIVQLVCLVCVFFFFNLKKNQMPF